MNRDSILPYGFRCQLDDTSRASPPIAPTYLHEFGQPLAGSDPPICQAMSKEQYPCFLQATVSIIVSAAHDFHSQSRQNKQDRAGPI